MPATLKLTHKSIGVEVRRGAYDVVVDGERVGSVEMNNTVEVPVEPGRHTLQVRNGRKSSRAQPFDAAEGETVEINKVVALIGQFSRGRSLSLIGLGECPSRGVIKGAVVDYKAASECVHHALEQAERGAAQMLVRQDGRRVF